MKPAVSCCSAHSMNRAPRYGPILHPSLTPKRFACFEHIKIRYGHIIQLSLKTTDSFQAVCEGASVQWGIVL